MRLIVPVSPKGRGALCASGPSLSPKEGDLYAPQDSLFLPKEEELYAPQGTLSPKVYLSYVQHGRVTYGTGQYGRHTGRHTREEYHLHTHTGRHI